jgi:exportin-1
VLTDRMHKSAFKSHCQIVGAMFQLLFSARVTVPLFDPAASPPDMTNQRFVCEYLASVLATAFPHIGMPRIQAFIMGIFPASVDEGRLKNFIRDFLIEMKEFSEDDTSELFNEEAAMAAAAAANDEIARRKAVPGLLGSLVEDFDEL